METYQSQEDSYDSEFEEAFNAAQQFEEQIMNEIDAEDEEFARVPVKTPHTLLLQPPDYSEPVVLDEKPLGALISSFKDALKRFKGIRSQEYEPVKYISGHQPFSICGDDLIGIWTKEFTNLYEEVVLKCGGRFSIGKHYRSSQYGIFTEEIF